VHCEEKYRLLALCRASVSRHSVAVNDLTLTRAQILNQEFDRLWALAEKSRAETEAASQAFFEHTREHGC
jgi:hypothetical protein